MNLTKYLSSIILIFILTNCNKVHQFYDSNMLITYIDSKEYNKAINLINEGIDVNYVNKYTPDNRTALHIAAAQGNVVISRMLIQAGAYINALDHLKNTPLHYAINSGNIDTIKLLIENGADLESPNVEGDTAILQVCNGPNTARKKKEIFDLLVKQEVNLNVINNKNQNLFFCDFILSDSELLAKVLEKNTYVNIESIFVPYRPIFLATRMGKFETIKTLIDVGADIYSTTSLTYKDDIANLSNTALEIAAEIPYANSNTKDIITILSNNNPNLINHVNRDGNTALHIAAAKGNILSLKTLIDLGGSVYIANNQNKTPLDILKNLSSTQYDEINKYINPVLNNGIIINN